MHVPVTPCCSRLPPSCLNSLPKLPPHASTYQPARPSARAQAACGTACCAANPARPTPPVPPHPTRTAIASPSPPLATPTRYDGIKYDTHQPPAAPTAEGAAEEAPKQVARTPNFASIDACLDPEMIAELGGTTRRKWSYPEYFVERWVEQEHRRQEERREAKKVGGCTGPPCARASTR